MLIRSENPYVLDYFYLNEKAFNALSKKNSDFLEAVLKMNNRYYFREDNLAPNKDYDLYSNKRTIRFCGSISYWFDAMNKDEHSFEESLLGAITAIDRMNITGLEVVENGRLLMRDAILKRCKNVGELYKAIDEPFEVNNENHIFRIISDAVNNIKSGYRHVVSFASNFCFYASKYLNTKNKYPKYSVHVARLLPYYAKFYLNKDYIFNFFRINTYINNKEDDKIVSKLKVYEEYNNIISQILSSLDEKVSMEAFENILYYTDRY